MASLLRNVQFLFLGSKQFGKEGYARACTHFDNSVNERRLDGRVCLVTGANQGLGFQTSQELAARGATLYMVCRNAQRGQEAVDAIRAKTGNADVHLKVCDVSSLESIAALARDFRASGQPLHVLVNNAGVLVHEHQQSADGLDINFATNTLGCFALTLLLEGPLKAGASSQGSSRVIFVSSGGMYMQPLVTDHERYGRMGSWYGGVTVYAQDKRRQVAIAERLAEMWGPAGVRVVSMHPGWTTTEGVKKSIPGFYSFFKNKFRTLEEGADTVVYLALEDAGKLVPGGFYLDRAPQRKHLPLACTAYGTREVDALWANLTALADKVLQPSAST